MRCVAVSGAQVSFGRDRGRQGHLPSAAAALPPAPPLPPLANTANNPAGAMELPDSILDAAEFGDLEAVQRWLAQNPDCIDLCSEKPESIGDTLLICALYAPRSDVARAGP